MDSVGTCSQDRDPAGMGIHAGGPCRALGHSDAAGQRMTSGTAHPSDGLGPIPIPTSLPRLWLSGCGRQESPALCGHIEGEKHHQVPARIPIAGMPRAAQGWVQRGTPHPVSSGMEVPAAAAAGPGHDLHFQVNR